MSDQAPVAVVETKVHEAFNFIDSDVTLRSSDGVLFRVHKARLSSHSQLFKDMFECATSAGSDELAHGIPVTETAAILSVLLPMCYPADRDLADPPVNLEALDHELLTHCYEACYKYKMWLAGQLLRRILLPRVSNDPLRLVRIAFITRDRDMIAGAAEAAIQGDLLENVEHKREKVGPAAWPALLEFHLQYRREVQNFLFHDLATSTSYGSRAITPCTQDRYSPSPCNSSLAPLYLRDLAWEKHRWMMGNRNACQLPKDSLLATIDSYLDEDAVRKCPGCRITWTTLRDRVKGFKVKCVFQM